MTEKFYLLPLSETHTGEPRYTLARRRFSPGCASTIEFHHIVADDVLCRIREAGHDDGPIAAVLAATKRQSVRIAGLDMDQVQIMGVVNMTPDSFSDGGRFSTPQAAIGYALQMEDDGASILDIGGESTRPGSDVVGLDEELARVLPVIEGLAGRVSAKISIDTRKAAVMHRAVDAGACILNDVSALLFDDDIMAAAQARDVPVILMHALGTPKTMQRDPQYDNALFDVYDFLEARIKACETAGIPRHRLIVDPGIGFGKTVGHNLALLAGLGWFQSLGVPVLLGASRKGFIGKLTGESVAARRAPGSIAAALAGVGQGVRLIRTHDVAETRQAITVWNAIADAR